MAFEVGEYVVYCGCEICRVCASEKKDFGGTEKEYFVLSPVVSEKSSYYIPIDIVDTKLRKLLTKEEILSIIDAMPTAVAHWTNDINERKNRYSQTIHGNNYGKLIEMMKTLYDEKQRRLDGGKRLPSADEKAMKAAETLLHQEFSVVLGIDVENVEEFIKNRLAEITGQPLDQITQE